MDDYREVKPLYSNRSFVLLMAARFVSQIGDRIHYFALTWYILNKIGTGSAVGTIMVFSTLPGVIMGPFTGVLADRFDRRKIMIAMDTARAAIAVTLGYLVMKDQAPLWTLYLGTGLLAICSAMYFPTGQALFPNLVVDSQLLKANSLNSFLNSLAMIAGPVLGGILFGLVGTEGAFALNGVTFVFSALCEVLIVAPKLVRHAEVKMQDFKENLVEGLKFVYQTKALLAMLIFGLVVNFFFFPVQDVIQPIVIKNILKLSAEEYGKIIAFFPGGLLLSTLLIQVLPQPKKKYKFMLWSMFSQSMGLILLALPILPIFMNSISAERYFYIYCGIALVRGLAFGFTNVPMAVVNQKLTPDEFRGRVYALQGTFYQGLMPISMGVAGFMADVVPAYAICIFAGLAMGASCLLMFKVEGIKQI
ncbi:MAG TPA: MFS transporter [Candidatus Nitrosocosmicus sp.]|nr:MFS transporter [Candidatus Nitrosocosmicus sp.]